MAEVTSGPKHERAARRVLVITPEPLPLPGQATTGAGLRAWGLTMGLRSRGFDAHVATCNIAFSDAYLTGAKPLPDYVHAFARNDIAALLRKLEPEVVVLQHWGMAHEVPDVDVPLVIDLAGPHLLERLYWNSPDILNDATMKLSALRRADFIVCSGKYQRHYFYSWLTLAGIDVRHMPVPIIPFSVPPEQEWPPERPRTPHSFVYGGMLLAWQDPSVGLTVLLEEMDRAKRGELHLFTGSHPVLDASAPHLTKLLETLAAHPRVRMHGIRPFDDLLQAYSGFEVAMDLMAESPERELAFATRTMIYLACGLPVIHGDYTELGELVRREGGGWAVSPRDKEALRALIRKLLDSPELIAQERRRALELARHYTWDRTIEPLAQFCENPTFRKDKKSVLMRFETLERELAEERERRAALENELARLRGKLVVRLASKLGGLRRVLAPVVWLLAWLAGRLVEFALLRTRQSSRR